MASYSNINAKLEGSVLIRIKTVELWILHPAAEPQDEVEGALLLDVVVGEGSPVLKLFSSEDKPLLVRRNPLLILKQVHMKSRSTLA